MAASQKKNPDEGEEPSAGSDETEGSKKGSLQRTPTIKITTVEDDGDEEEQEEEEEEEEESKLHDCFPMICMEKYVNVLYLKRAWHPAAIAGATLMSPSLCNSFEDRAPVDKIYGYPIFRWGVET